MSMRHATPADIGYPRDIRTLTSLRFFAAFMVFAHHIFQFFPQNPGTHLFEKGYLAVDLFFILSGFILCHVYNGQFPGARGAHWKFLVRRLARVYPLHFVIFLALVFWAFIGILRGTIDAQDISLSGLLSNLFLLHGWGMPGALAWNGPSWSISGEWFAYIVFPFMLPLLARFNPLLLLIASYAAYVAFWGLSFLIDPDAPLTVYTNAFRVMPAFILGMALYHYGRGFTLAYSRQLAAATSLVVLWLMCLGVMDVFVVCLSGVLILLLADSSRLRGGGGWLSGAVPVYLGRVSYAFYMVHYPVIVLVFQPLFTEHCVVSFFAGAAAVAVLTLFLAALLYRYVEVPCRKWIVRHGGGAVA